MLFVVVMLFGSGCELLMWCGDVLVYVENEYVKFNERKRSAIFQRSTGSFDIFFILFLLYVEGDDVLGVRRTGVEKDLRSSKDPL